MARREVGVVNPSFYDRVASTLRRVNLYSLFCCQSMEFLDLETSDDARIWVNRVILQLDYLLESNEEYHLSIPDPEDPFWAVAIADELSKNWQDFESVHLAFQVAGMDATLLKIAKWLRISVVKPISDESTALKRLVSVQSATQLYLRIRQGRFSRASGALLQVAFASGHDTALRMGVDLLLQQPPESWSSGSLALSPLLQYSDWNTDAVFPKILESTHPSVLASALDIANHLFLEGTVSRHPCLDRFRELVDLLGAIVQRLALLEENPGKFGNTTDSIQRILFDSVSLCVSLCHTMALIGNESCIGKLNQASELKHRRIRAEAAYALAKLGQKHGNEMLLELVKDPSIRLRVLAYCDELGSDQEIDDSHRNVLSIAEAQLAQWLAQVEQMGLPPNKIELVEQRTLPWPGFDSPQECFLFRFAYSMQDREYSNVAIAGPTTKAFSTDLANISTDDAFSIFVGWDIEHPDVYETPFSRLSANDSELINRWQETLLRDHFSEVEPVFVGTLIQQKVLLGFGSKQSKRQSFAYDGSELIVPTSLPSTQESILLTYYLWRGREFLRSFA